MVWGKIPLFFPGRKVRICSDIPVPMMRKAVYVKTPSFPVFQLENEKGRAPGRALGAQWTKEGAFYRKQAFKFVKKVQLRCQGTNKGSLLMHELVAITFV